MKTPPPDRTSIVKELEKRLLKKWAEENLNSEKVSPDKKAFFSTEPKKKK